MAITKKANNRYSEAFKLQVVNDLESGKLGSISEANRHYGIPGGETVKKWLIKYGRNHLVPKVICVEKPEEQNQIKKLKSEVKQLKEALADTHMQSLLNEAVFEELCEEVGVDPEAFKKKVSTQQLNVPRRSRRKVVPKRRR